jgi:hypothetical protein
MEIFSDVLGFLLYCRYRKDPLTLAGVSEQFSELVNLALEPDVTPPEGVT